MKDLKEKALRGALAKICSQSTSFLLRLGSLMIMARLLDPKDFGLVGMVTALLGVFNVFRDFGLSAAAIQRNSVTKEQITNLFWINLCVGLALGTLTLVMAPFVARFYHEPRLLTVTMALAAGFVFNAAGVQHTSLLERQLRFTTLSAIDVLSLLISMAVGIAMAYLGFGYWALVATALSPPLTYTIGAWIATGWIPGRPHRQVGVRTMIRFGSAITLNGLLIYIASNFDKVLLGRFWGPGPTGIYGRAYQLINIPTDNLNSSAGGVAFAALSRLQGDPDRFRNYFLKGYSVVLSLTVPITFTCALFANDLILVFLGPKWIASISIFRLLAPTTLAFAILNPLGWLLTSLGLVKRSLLIATVLCPTMILGYLMGLRYGPQGVATGYSAVMAASAIPLIAWAVHGTAVSFGDMLHVLKRPFASGAAAAGVAWCLLSFYGAGSSSQLRLAVGVTVLFGVYAGMLLYVMGQKSFYRDLFIGLKTKASIDNEGVASA